MHLDGVKLEKAWAPGNKDYDDVISIVVIGASGDLAKKKVSDIVTFKPTVLLLGLSTSYPL